MIYITGDTHGDFRKFNHLNLKDEDIMIILGDVGINYYLDDYDRNLKERLSKYNFKFFFIQGNHEERPENISSYHEVEMFGGQVYIEDEYPNLIFDSTSGWFAQDKNDFDSEHIYFKAIKVEPKERPMFLSECGGYSMAVENHYYSKYNVYGYGGSDDAAKLTDDILNLYEVMVLPAAPKGMCGCIYTQLSDVEDEINGLYTYDRKVCKVEKDRMTVMAEKLQEAVK